MEHVIDARTHRTVVRNLADAGRGQYRIYSLDPKSAVVAAHEQSTGNYNTWDYPAFDEHPEAIEGDMCVACGDFAAFKSLATQDVMRRFPRIVAHIIAESLGYATPTCAARILHRAMEHQEDWCEWVYTCYGRNARKCVAWAVRNRRLHKGYMAEYRRARALVEQAIATRREPELASWF